MINTKSQKSKYIIFGIIIVFGDNINNKFHKRQSNTPRLFSPFFCADKQKQQHNQRRRGSDIATTVTTKRHSVAASSCVFFLFFVFGCLFSESGSSIQQKQQQQYYQTVCLVVNVNEGVRDWQNTKESCQNSERSAEGVWN